MNKIIKWGLAGIICLFAGQLFSQGIPKGMYFEGGMHLGKIYKHSPQITIPIDSVGLTLGADLNWELHQYGKRHWHQKAGYPIMGVVLSYQQFGEPRLGFGLGLMPHVTVKFFQSKNLLFFGRLAMGVAFLSKPWDINNNPTNNIVGSHINNNTAFRLGLSIKAHPQFELRPSFSFTHYSNGSTQFPNFGINALSLHLGVLFKPNPILPEDYIKSEETAIRNKRIQFGFAAGMGMQELARTLRGPKYPIYAAQLDAGFFLLPCYRVKLGLNYEFHGPTYTFTQQYSGANNEEAIKKATRLLVGVEQEVLLGRIAVVGQIAFHVYERKQQPWFMATRIGGRYYILDPYKAKVAPYIGLTLKAHQITAEYFWLHIGAAF